MPGQPTINCYSDFVQHLPQALILSDRKGEIRYLNKSFFQLSEFTIDELKTLDNLAGKLFKNKSQKEYFKKFWTKLCNSAVNQGPRTERSFKITTKSMVEKEVKICLDFFNEDFIAILFTEMNNEQVNIQHIYSEKHRISSSLASDINSEPYYKQIVDLANVAIVKFDKNLSITDFTGNSENIFGFTKSEVIGRSLYDTIVPSVESTGRDLKRLIKDIIFNTKHYEYNVNENIRKDGRRIWMQWYNTEIRGNKNDLIGILSIGIDISDRINAEIALKQSEHRFKMLSNLTFEGILIHDQGFIHDCNLSLEKQIGYTRDELIGEHIFKKIVPREYHALMSEKFGQKSAQYEAIAVHKNGTRIPISIHSRDVLIGDKILRVAAIRDISKLKKTIEELNKYKNQLEEKVIDRTKELKKKNDAVQFERNQLRTIIDNIPDFIYIKDHKSRFLNVNKQLIEHLDKKRLDEITGKTDFDFYPEEYAREYFNDEQNILNSGISIINKDEPCINSRGQKIYLSTTKVPLKDKEGNIVSIIGIGKDITEKLKAEIKLKQQAEDLRKVNMKLEEKTKNIQKLNLDLNHSNKNLETANKILHDQKEELETTLNKLKSAQTHLIQSEKMASLGILMAGIAHEINNPVNFVYAGVNSIMKDFDDVKIVSDQINLLQANTISSISVVNKIIELKDKHEYQVAMSAIEETLHDIKLGASRISEIVKGLGRFTRMETEEWKNTNLHEELDNVLLLLKNRYKHHIQIIKKYKENLPLVECFPGKLNQVFMNIISNAIDAIGNKRGEIIIKTDFSSDNAIVSIKDTGKGIEDKHVIKIFDPFFTTKEVGFGMGLGLAISYSIIQEHSGEILVKSKLNHGTEIIVRLPLKQL